MFRRRAQSGDLAAPSRDALRMDGRTDDDAVHLLSSRIEGKPARHQTWIEMALLFGSYVSFVICISSWFALPRPLDLASLPMEHHTGRPHWYLSDERHPRPMLALATPDGHTLLKFACSQISRSCAELAKLGLATIGTVRSTEGHVVPIEVLGKDASVVIGEEEQLSYLASERRSTLHLAWGSSAAMVLCGCAWFFLRSKRSPKELPR